MTNTPLSVALGAACAWLESRPQLRANPEILIEFVRAWVAACNPDTLELAEQCGTHAVKECAGCRTVTELNELIEPQDLMD